MCRFGWGRKVVYYPKGTTLQALGRVSGGLSSVVVALVPRPLEITVPKVATMENIVTIHFFDGPALDNCPKGPLDLSLFLR